MRKMFSGSMITVAIAIAAASVVISAPITRALAQPSAASGATQPQGHQATPAKGERAR